MRMYKIFEAVEKFAARDVTDVCAENGMSAGDVYLSLVDCDGRDIMINYNERESDVVFCKYLVGVHRLVPEKSVSTMLESNVWEVTHLRRSIRDGEFEERDVRQVLLEEGK